MLKNRILICSVLALASLTPNFAQAHFPWLFRSDNGKATLYFGENIAERNYKLPPSIAKAELKIVNAKGDLDSIQVTAVENDLLVGLQSVETVPADACLVSQVTFGIYHGSRLNYYTLHQGGKLPTTTETTKSVACNQELYT